MDEKWQDQFTAKEIVTIAVQSTIEALSKLNRGDFVTMSFLEQSSGLVKDVAPWTVFIERLKRDFRESRGIVLWGQPGGYRLLTVREQLFMVPKERAKRSASQLTKGIEEIACTPPKEMTDFERSAAWQKEQSLRKQRRQTNVLRRHLEQHDKPNDPPQVA